MTHPDDWPSDNPPEPNTEPDHGDVEVRDTGDATDIRDPLDDDHATEPDR